MTLILVVVTRCDRGGRPYLEGQQETTHGQPQTVSLDRHYIVIQENNTM